MTTHALILWQGHAGKLTIFEAYFKEETMVNDMLAMEKYEDKSGNEKVKYNRVGVAFKAKNGGMNCQPFPGIALTGPFIIRPRKKAAAEPEEFDDGADFLDE
jgi:hypothetical protein